MVGKLIIRTLRDGGAVVSDQNNNDLAAFGCVKDALEYIKAALERC